MSNNQTPAPKELIDAFDAYKATEDYQNTRKWALHDEHVDGSLWAAWLAGRASVAAPSPATPEAEGPKRHLWNQDGETCLDCGQKDWMRGSVCTPASPPAAQEQKPVALGIDVDPAAIDALKNYQRQLDPDGDEVGVSRQALDEVLTAIERVGLSASPIPASGEGWVDEPDAQGLWWYWNGDSDAAPYPCTVLWSGTANKYFVCIKDIVNAPFCDTLTGKWLHIPQVVSPGETK